MMTLLVETGMEMSWEQGAVRLTEKGKLVKRVPVNMLSTVWIMNNVRLCSKLLLHLATHDIAVTLLPNRANLSPCSIGKLSMGSVNLRHAQHYHWHDSHRHLTMVKQVLRAKCQGYSLALKLPIFQPFAAQVAEFQQCLHQSIKDIEQAEQYPQLLGYEGHLAKQWFGHIKLLVDERFQFTGRNRRPPKDPLNALLSLTYTICLSDLINACTARGFDLAFGFLHQIYPERQAFVLDLLEPFRPLIDIFCVELLQTKMQLSDFSTTTAAGCRLTRQGQQIYYPALHWFRQQPLQTIDDSTSLWPNVTMVLSEQSFFSMANRVADACAQQLIEQHNKSEAQ